jgi:hypothetical protein
MTDSLVTVHSHDRVLIVTCGSDRGDRRADASVAATPVASQGDLDMNVGKIEKLHLWLALGALPILAVVAAGSGTAVAEPKHADDDRRGAHWHQRDLDKYAVALFGDMPYNAIGKAQYPNLLADVNASDVAFSVFDGDLKSGGDGPCTDENLYTPALAHFATLEQPLVLVPGDNDWTDCWGRYGAGTGNDDPIERLNHERELFWSTPYSLGQRKMRLARQSYEGGAYAPNVENVRWRLGPVVYLGLNVQGSNDNYPYAGVDGETRSEAEIARQRAEEVARKAANLHWLSTGFDYAKSVGARGVMIVWQADPNFNNEHHLADPHSWDAYPDYVNALRDQTSAFAGEVVLVHGDSHYFVMDKPINAANGGVLRNFTRVQTFGARNTHWVRATIDASARNLFVFEPQMVPGND